MTFTWEYDNTSIELPESPGHKVPFTGATERVAGMPLAFIFICNFLNGPRVNGNSGHSPNIVRS